MNSQNQQASYGQVPLIFIANTGQTDPSVKFQVKGAGHSIFFTPNEITFIAFQTPNEPGKEATKSSVVRSSLANSNPNPTIYGLEKLPGVANFLLGENSSQWQTNVPTFNGVVYQNVYPGIDRVFKGTEGQLKSEFLVAPFADPSQIKMNYTGVSDIRLGDDGALILETPLGELIDNAPIVYQDINGQRVNVPAAYNLLGNGQVNFSFGDFDRTQPLVIDPVLAYSTYLGGSGNDTANRMTVDSTGAAYIIGTTVNNFTTTPGAYKTTPAGGTDFLVTKINPEGTALVYSTYIGGSGNEYGFGIAVDNQGNAYLTGQVDPGFPTTTGSYQPTATTYNAAATKLNAAGNSLVYSTFLGGSGTALGTSIAVDNQGNAYVTGPTGDNFPTIPVPVYGGGIDPFIANQPVYGGGIDAFIAKVNPTGSDLVYSTYFGGSNREEGQAIAVDNNGKAYVTGITYSTNLPVTIKAVQNTIGGGEYDAFVSKFDADGARSYATYLGGRGGEKGGDIAVDSSGNAYVVGTTNSINFPRVNPIEELLAGVGNDFFSSSNAFVSKLSPSGNSLIYSTFLGGSGDDNGHRITVDSANNVYVTGDTTSTNFPTKNAIQSVSGGGKDAFVTSINSSGSASIDSTYLGGSGDDAGNGIAVNSSGEVYVAGGTNSTNFPTANPLQVANGGGDNDAFITKIIPGGPQVKIIESGSSTNLAESGTTDTYTVVLTNQPTANVAIAFTGTQIQPITALNFTPTNWFLPQTVTVSAVDDSVAETSPHSGPIAQTATSTDVNYQDITISPVSVAITDNDSAGVSITPTNTTATEGGANGSYSVQLNTQPTASVTINLATGSQIQPITALTFTATNWNVPQSVTVAAVDDTVVEGAHSGSIAHNVSSTDSKYNGIVVPGVTVAIADNDTAPTPVTTTPTPVTTTPTPVTTTPTPVTTTPTPVTTTPTPVTTTPRPVTTTPMPAGNSTIDLSKNWCGVEAGLDKLENILDNQLQTIKLPIIGPLKDIYPNFIDNFKSKLVNAVKNGENQSLSQLESSIRNTLGPDFDVKVDGNSTADDSTLLITLGKKYQFPDINLSKDLGVPALGLNIDGKAKSKYEYNLSLGVGSSKDFGCYIDTDKTKLTANIDLGLDDQFKAKGNLDFFQVDLANDTKNPTKVDANLEVKLNDLDNLGGTDDGNRLTLSELDGSYQLQDLFQSSLTSNANLGLHGKTSINGDAAFPSFDFDLAVNWPILNYANGQLTRPQKPTVAFNNMQLDVGTFVNNFAKPIVGKISDVIQPFRPVIEFLNADTKLLSKIGLAEPFYQNGDGKVSVLELAAKISGRDIDTRFLDAVAQVDKVVNLANQIANFPRSN